MASTRIGRSGRSRLPQIRSDASQTTISASRTAHRKSGGRAAVRNAGCLEDGVLVTVVQKAIVTGTLTRALDRGARLAAVKDVRLVVKDAPLLEHVRGFCRASSRRLIRQAIAKIRP
jgi:hypothetical protein